MFEAQTYEALMERMLGRIPATLDKREGSIIYDALAPAAAEMAQFYGELDRVLRLGFGQTSSGVYLELRSADRGLQRKPAAAAVWRGAFWQEAGGGEQPLDVPLGSRFSAGQVNFSVRAQLAPGQFELVSEQAGELGNNVTGALLPLDYIPGLARAELAELLLAGFEAESDEALRARYLQAVQEPGTSGNAADYRRWAAEVDGVGAVKIAPLWAGPGTVKVVITDADFQPATLALIERVDQHIAALRPIGAAITVASAAGLAIDVSASVVLAAGYSLQPVKLELERRLAVFLQEIAFQLPYVSYARIGTLLLGIPGVIDYTDLFVNGGQVNIALQEDEVPVPGTVSLGV